MKAVSALLLSAFAFSVTAAPVFCEEPTPYFEIPADAPEPVQAVLSKCNAMVAALQRCTDALGTVDGKESADAVAAVLQQEMRVICSLRDECVEIFAANQDVFPPESDEFAGEVVLSSIALRIGDAMNEAAAPFMEALETAMGQDGGCHGSSGLSAAAVLCRDVLDWGMTVEESAAVPGSVEACMEYNAICTEAWEGIASVHDRASADAAAARLAVLRNRSDAVTDRLKAILDTLREDRLPGFIGQVTGFAVMNLDDAGRSRMDSAKAEAEAKMEELGAMDQPFYGSTELEENAGAFIMMPR